LLRDWGRPANTAQIRVAQANARVADLEWQSRTAQVVAEVMKRYYDVVFTLENLSVQRESIALAQKLLDDTRARGKEGVAAANDVQVAEAGVYQRMEDALEAEMLYIERQNALQLLFKTPEQVIAQGSRIQPVDGLRAKVPAASRASLVSTALEHRYEVRQAEEFITVKSAELDYATSQSRPRLDLVASGGYHGLEGDLGGSYGKAADGQGPEWSAGVQFSMPLNQDNLNAQRRAARDEKTRAYIRRGETRLRVALEVDTVLSRLRMDEQRLGATRKSREAAAQSAEGGMKRLNEGVTTSFEVLQLQEDFSKARSREYAALADLNKAVVDLQLATGTLLEQQGVEVISDAPGTRQRYAEEPVVMINDEKDATIEAQEDEILVPPVPQKRPTFSKAKRN
jgi:outer membrane protein TolC